ncbi:MAG: tyrosine-type recombinase/integrase [Pseudomonadales bacterium]
MKKGVHNLRHTCGRRLRAAGVPLETRKAILGHAHGDITTHYSAAELGELISAAEKISKRGTQQTPTLTVLTTAGVSAGQVSENCRNGRQGRTAKGR